MAYDNQCGSCANFTEASSDRAYDSSNASYVKGFCTWYRAYYYPDDSCDNHYKSRSGGSSLCYITTMVHSVLKMDDKTESLEVLRNFRSGTLQKNKKYKEILFEYDSVGPQIAKKLKEEDIIIVKEIYTNYLLPVVKLIKERKNKEAIDKYKVMIKKLKKLYHIEDVLEVPDNYDYTRGGHGKR